MAIEGQLSELDIPSLVQMILQERAQARLAVRRGETRAELFFDGDNIVHAALDAPGGGRSGEEVVDELLRWQDGTFSLERNVAPPARSITTDWSTLLLKGLQRAREPRAAGGQLSAPPPPPAAAGRQAAASPAPPAAAPPVAAPPASPAAAPSVAAPPASPAAVAPIEFEKEQTQKKEDRKMTIRRRSEVLAETLTNLMNTSADIEGAVVVSGDGLVIASHLPRGMDDARVGASAAALLALSKRSTPQLGRGNYAQSLIQGDNGNIIIISAGEQAIFVGLTAKSVNLGMVFLEARDAANAIAEVL